MRKPESEHEGTGHEVFFVPIEKVICQDGTFTIFQANARSSQDIEDTIITLIDQGIVFAPLDTLNDPVFEARTQPTPLPINDPEFSTAVFLAGSIMMNKEDSNN